MKKAPEFIKTELPVNTAVAVWFRGFIEKGGMPGLLRGWEDTDEGTFIIFEAVGGEMMYLPFADVYLAEMPEDKLPDARAEHALQQRVKDVNRTQMRMQVEQAEAGGAGGPSVMPARMMPPQDVLRRQGR